MIVRSRPAVSYGGCRILFMVVLAVFASIGSAAQGQPEISDVFRNELACLLIEPLQADMPIAPLYVQGDTCLAVAPDENTGTQYFSDDSCQTSLAFEPTLLIDHCSVLIDSSRLGEGQGIDSLVWTLPPGTRFDVSAKPLDNVMQPYLQRQVYRTIETTAGTCSLEMRIYASHPSATGQQSLLALHGGSWSARGFGFFGLELTIPHFVEQGFVVYAPFYRLLGDSEGSAACHDASIAEVVDDATAALQWVQEHAEEFGSAAKPVVFGQSAGAHLATSLAVNNPTRVAAAVLFYPPTDFTDFALRAKGGFYTNEQGLGILGRVLGTSAADADISASPIPENSFPIQIVERDLDVPPMFMLHGMADELVEARQSVRLCDALAGRELGQTDEPIDELSELREIFECGTDSQMQLVREGQHALDVCFVDAVLATDLCLSGSEASREQVSQAIGDALVFAQLHASDANKVTAEPSSNPTSTGGGVAHFPIIVILVLAGFIRRLTKTIASTAKSSNASLGVMKKPLIKIWLAALCLACSISARAADVPQTDAFDVAAYKGKVVYVDFWASWCTPCRASFPFMADLASQYGEDLAIVAINVDESRSDADAFLATFDTPFDIVYDAAGELAKAFKVPGMPTSYLYDRDGKFLQRHIGFRKADQAALRDSIVSALGQ